MNKKRIIYLLLPVLALIVLVTGWNILSPKPCASDGTRVCLIKNTGMFAIEDKAKVTLKVPDKAYGDAILALFAAKHPENKDVLSVVVNTINGDPLPDIDYLTQNEAALRYASLIGIDETLKKLWEKNLQWDKSSELNKDDLRFIPMSGSGFSFIYDATVLARLNVDLKDTDLDGLPDGIDTMEEVKAVALKYIAENKQRTYTSVFPIQFNEALSFYPLLTIGGWRMFPDHTATLPGFDTPEFLKALKNISDLGSSSDIKDDKIDPAKLIWQFDQILTDQEFLFSMASDWMFVEAFETRTKQDVRNARFPSVGNVIPSPLLNVAGFSVNTKVNPSAISEVLRIIRSPEGLAAFAKIPATTLLADPSLLATLKFDTQKQKDLALTYVHSMSIPLVALEGNPTVLGFTMYRQIAILPIVKKVFLGEISPEEAQTAIAKLAKDWIDVNHGYPSEAIKK